MSPIESTARLQAECNTVAVIGSRRSPTEKPNLELTGPGAPSSFRPMRQVPLHPVHHRRHTPHRGRVRGRVCG